MSQEPFKATRHDVSGLDPLARSAAARRRHDKAVQRGRDKHLAKARREIRKALQEQARAAASAYRRGRSDWQDAVTAKPMSKAYSAFARDVIMSFAHGTLRSIEQKKQLTDDVLLTWEEHVAAWLATTAAQRITDMNQATKRMLAALLQQAVAEGMSIPNSANHIQSTFNRMSLMRATRIARTEIVAASNYGSLEGATATGLPLRKQWLATMDDRTRDSHLDVNGDTAPLDGHFSVNGHAMEYPGDPSGPAGEVINCRCTIIYVEV